MVIVCRWEVERRPPAAREKKKTACRFFIFSLSLVFFSFLAPPLRRTHAGARPRTPATSSQPRMPPLAARAVAAARAVEFELLAALFAGALALTVANIIVRGGIGREREREGERGR